MFKELGKCHGEFILLPSVAARQDSPFSSAAISRGSIRPSGDVLPGISVPSRCRGKIRAPLQLLMLCFCNLCIRQGVALSNSDVFRVIQNERGRICGLIRLDIKEVCPLDVVQNEAWSGVLRRRDYFTVSDLNAFCVMN